MLGILGVLAAIGVASLQTSVEASRKSTAAITVELIATTINAKAKLDSSLKNTSMSSNSDIVSRVFDDNASLKPDGVVFRVIPTGGGEFEVHASSVTEKWADICRTQSLDRC